MKFNKNILKEKWFAYTFAMCSAVILYLALTHLGTFLTIIKTIWRVGAPVFMGFVITYVIAPLVKLYSNHVFHRVGTERLRHTLSAVLSFLTIILFFVILMVALVPQIIESVVMFARNLNGYVYSLQRLMLQLSSLAAKHDIDLSKFISSSDELLQSITRVLPENVNKIVNVSYGFGTKVFDWIISFILAIYMTMDSKHLKEGFLRLLRSLMSEHVFDSTAAFWSKCNRILIQYIAFDVLDGLVIGILNWVFMVIMHMPYVAIVSVIVGTTNLAPTFGPMIGAVLGAFVLVLVNPWQAVWFLLFTLVLQTFDGYILKPRLFGEQLGVSSVWILISLIIGGRLLGVIGILLAIPFAAIADFIYHEHILVRLEKRAQNARCKEKSPETKDDEPASEIFKEALEDIFIHEDGGTDSTANDHNSDDQQTGTIPAAAENPENPQSAADSDSEKDSEHPAEVQAADAQAASSQAAGAIEASSQAANAQAANAKEASSQAVNAQAANAKEASPQAASSQDASSQAENAQAVSSQAASSQDASSQAENAQAVSSQAASSEEASSQAENAQSPGAQFQNVLSGMPEAAVGIASARGSKAYEKDSGKNIQI